MHKTINMQETDVPGRMTVGPTSLNAQSNITVVKPQFNARKKGKKAKYRADAIFMGVSNNRDCYSSVQRGAVSCQNFQIVESIRGG